MPLTSYVYCEGNYIEILMLISSNPLFNIPCMNIIRIFWTLVALIHNKVHPDTYRRDLRGCHIEQRVLKELIDR